MVQKGVISCWNKYTTSLFFMVLRFLRTPTDVKTMMCVVRTLWGKWGYGSQRPTEHDNVYRVWQTNR
jgi:hypothetical protein